MIVVAEPKAYRETIAGAIRSLRPSIVVTALDPVETDWVTTVPAADLVVCSQLTAAVEQHAPAWVQLYADGSIETVVTVNGQRTVQRDIDFGQLLRVVDQAEAITG